MKCELCTSVAMENSSLCEGCAEAVGRLIDNLARTRELERPLARKEGRGAPRAVPGNADRFGRYKY